MSEYQYLELRTVNTSKTSQQLVFENTRTLPILTDEMKWDLSIIRFDLDSSLVSCYTPKIVSNPTYFLSTSKALVARPAYTSQYLTNLEIVLETDTSYCSLFVEWFPYSSQYLPPPAITEQSVLASQYFQSYSSLHLCGLIEKTLNKLFGAFTEFCDDIADTPIKFKKNPNGYMLLLPEDLYNTSVSAVVPFTLSWSDTIDSIFGFDTSEHKTAPNYSTFIFDSSSFVPISIGYPLKVYLPIYTGHQSSYMFPYKLVKFVTSDLQARPMKKMNTVNDNENMNENILTDFVFNLSDVEDVYGSIYYAPSSYQREINILRTYNANTIRIQVLLETQDNRSCPFYLDAGRSASILIRFSGVPR